MYSEDNLLPLSALQHLFFCKRQCALIHVEQLWTENLFTAEGRIMHDKVHEENKAYKGSVRVEYGMSLRSLRLGLVGKADVVEFHRVDESSAVKWRPFPVEYKRGKPKGDDCDKVQLCAQALCLEEMLNISVPRGALFYGKTRRRQDVTLDDRLRSKTKAAAERLHKLIDSGRTPMPVWGPKCKHCSLQQLCMPEVVARERSVNRYLLQVMRKP